jgi:hypothetical protein
MDENNGRRWCWGQSEEEDQKEVMDLYACFVRGFSKVGGLKNEKEKKSLFFSFHCGFARGRQKEWERGFERQYLTKNPTKFPKSSL